MRPHALVSTALAAALLGAALSPSAPARATTVHTVPASTIVQRTSHVRIYGYLQDRAPATDRKLDVYSKAHRKHYAVFMMSDTVVKIKTQRVHRAVLRTGMYVIITCRRNAHGDLEAITLHIEHPRSHKRTT